MGREGPDQTEPPDTGNGYQIVEAVSGGRIIIDSLLGLSNADGYAASPIRFRAPYRKTVHEEHERFARRFEPFSFRQRTKQLTHQRGSARIGPDRSSEFKV
ncbi:hypothetical protein RMHFA_05712 (plasmid) [Roseomonas mucosa]|nr:hypothetical protein RMHFA_05712 [Roseomonas mucosa]